MLSQVLASLLECDRVLSTERITELLKWGVTLEDLRGWIRFDAGHYARNLIYRSSCFELLCLCWKPGQQSLPHDHGSSISGFRVIRGKASETMFLPGAREDQIVAGPTRSLLPGEVASGDRGLIHRIGNARDSEEDLITLHLYSPPLTDYRRFDSL